MFSQLVEIGCVYIEVFVILFRDSGANVFYYCAVLSWALLVQLQWRLMRRKIFSNFKHEG